MTSDDFAWKRDGDVRNGCGRNGFANPSELTRGVTGGIGDLGLLGFSAEELLISSRLDSLEA